MTHLFSVHSVDFYNFVAASSLVCFCNSSAVTVGRFSLPLAPHLVRVMFLIVFFLRHQFVGRYSISMHAYRKWRACWPCVCLVFDVVPFSKSTSHAACVERHECNARAWEKSHAWLWTWSGILHSKDANANRVPLLLRNEKTQPRFVYHMGMRGLSFHLIPIIWDLQPKTRYYTLLPMSKPFDSLCISLWDLLGVFISVFCLNTTQSPCPKRLVVDDCLLHKKYSKIKTPYCRYDIIV